MKSIRDVVDLLNRYGGVAFAVALMGFVLCILSVALADPGSVVRLWPGHEFTKRSHRPSGSGWLRTRAMSDSRQSVGGGTPSVSHLPGLPGHWHCSATQNNAFCSGRSWTDLMTSLRSLVFLELQRDLGH